MKLRIILFLTLICVQSISYAEVRQGNLDMLKSALSTVVAQTVNLKGNNDRWVYWNQPKVTYSYYFLNGGNKAKEFKPIFDRSFKELQQSTGIEFVFQKDFRSAGISFLFADNWKQDLLLKLPHLIKVDRESRNLSEQGYQVYLQENQSTLKRFASLNEGGNFSQVLILSNFPENSLIGRCNLQKEIAFSVLPPSEIKDPVIRMTCVDHDGLQPLNKLIVKQYYELIREMKQEHQPIGTQEGLEILKKRILTEAFSKIKPSLITKLHGGVRK